MIGTEFVREGDTISDGIKIVKINPVERNAERTKIHARVEFEKDGKRWTQKEGDAPDPAWR